MPNVILTPHIGATTVDAQREIGVEIVRIVEERAAAKVASVTTPAETPAGAR
jgi:phosphoglycerate dehydrogenase-like enzyme